MHKNKTTFNNKSKCFKVKQPKQKCSASFGAIVFIRILNLY